MDFREKFQAVCETHEVCKKCQLSAPCKNASDINEPGKMTDSEIDAMKNGIQNMICELSELMTGITAERMVSLPVGYLAKILMAVCDGRICGPACPIYGECKQIGELSPDEMTESEIFELAVLVGGEEE